MAKITKQDALNYHYEGRPGKIEVVPTKPYSTQRDLALAYSPGVADPCLEIEKDRNNVYKYTAKGNLVAVISNGTAVLGLGNLGPEAGKPVMEGKGLLFKIFSDIDVFDIELDTNDVDKFVETVKLISPTFGGINLEDIKAPECFEIERRLKEELDIPVMHDDQHGTAIISSAGIINALDIVGKKIEDVTMVVSGAGASAMACTKLLISLGVQKENVVMCDSKGAITSTRTGLSTYKQEFITTRKVNTLAEALKDADIFLGLSVKDLVSKEMVKSMANDPIVFAMANPDPEISYEDAIDAREDIIMATGRSDYPNQVNNVLGFPFIFRGALDVGARGINEEMKRAAVYAIAALAKEPVPEEVNAAYNEKHITYGRDYIIPKPMDPRLISTVAPAVAKAAMDSGIANAPILDWDIYAINLKARVGGDNKLISRIHFQAKQDKKKVVFSDAENYNVLRAAQISMHEGILEPIIIGNKTKILSIIKEYELHDLLEVEIIDPASEINDEQRELFIESFYEKQKRNGFSRAKVNRIMHYTHYWGPMMVEHGLADALITGFSTKYSSALSPILEVAKCSSTIDHVAGMYILMTKKGPYFFADTTVTVNPTAENLVSTTILTANTMKKLKINPKIAMVSFSNFGTSKLGNSQNIKKAVGILHRDYPNLVVDGEMQANFALNSEMRQRKFPFSKLEGMDVNTLIFPNLSSGNIAYKMLQEIGGAEALGPILMGVKKPMHIVQLESSVREIANMAALAVVDAQVSSK